MAPTNPTASRVIFYMDGLGIRPTLFAMSQRLADEGYVVLLPDLYYRAGPYEGIPTEMATRLDDALTAAGVEHHREIYAGAQTLV